MTCPLRFYATDISYHPSLIAKFVRTKSLASLNMCQNLEESIGDFKNLLPLEGGGKTTQEKLHASTTVSFHVPISTRIFLDVTLDGRTEILRSVPPFICTPARQRFSDK
eukprot:TRINITY_DN3864_c0_g2_i1.p2 TRINITY_DN3864_c0_g2~~TRINITY_DN3864_c0_g2_i1.p2  ORF type:complete len:109 (+),score=7.71 TRINITY_DN3864_c0_g2_i1:88-414(+)